MKLFISATFGTCAAFIFFAKLAGELTSYGFGTLFTHRETNYPAYQVIVADVLPLLELTIITYMHPFIGTFCSLPFLFSTSTAKWLEDHSSASIASGVSRLVNGSVRKGSQTPNSVSVVGASFALPP